MKKSGCYTSAVNLSSLMNYKSAMTQFSSMIPESVVNCVR
jgi:hypothetical protein